MRAARSSTSAPTIQSLGHNSEIQPSTWKTWRTEVTETARSLGSGSASIRFCLVLAPAGWEKVYRARDLKLERDVAIKVLPPRSALDHPHIAAIHGFEESDGVRALVLELVEGPTLADRLARGSLSVKEALSIARQIAEALEAAHERGITHRDLKPANIKLKAGGAPPPRAEDRRLERSLLAPDYSDGVVKVLDFGLAKELAAGAVDPHGSQLTTRDATSPGLIMGTPAYMSPEQARGQKVDKRTDIWRSGACSSKC